MTSTGDHPTKQGQMERDLAVARRALEAVRKIVADAKPVTLEPEASVRNEIDRQLSLLGARNFECVEIPQGERKDIDQMDKKG